MLKSALGVLFSFLMVLTPLAAHSKEAKSTSGSKQTTSQSAKKNTAADKKTAAKSSKPAASSAAANKTSSKASANKSASKASNKAVASSKSASAKNTKSSKTAVKAGKSSARQSASLNANEKLVKKSVVVNGKRKTVYERERIARPEVPVVPPVMTAGDVAGLNLTRDPLALASNVALVLDQSDSTVLFEKNANVTLPIASITKLMTGLVVVESHQDMNEMLEVTSDDIDREKNSSSRLRVGSKLSRANMLHIALMSSENRAASALGRHYPGGLPAFVKAMNAKARELGMTGTHYVDSTGLSSQNVATARDLAKLVTAASRHSVLCQYSTDTKYLVEPGGHSLQYANSNRLVNSPDWEIGLQKTGYISEAGRCLVMQATINGRPIVMIFLDSKGKYSRLGDAQRIRKWIEQTNPQNAGSKTHAIQS